MGWWDSLINGDSSRGTPQWRAGQERKSRGRAKAILLAIGAVSVAAGVATHTRSSQEGNSHSSNPPASSEGTHQTTTTAPTQAPPKSEAPNTTKPPEKTTPSPTPKETQGGQGGGQSGKTTTECGVGGPGLECTNNGGNPNPIEVTVTDTGDDLNFSTGVDSWSHSKRQDKTSDHPLKTRDSSCTVTVETIAVGKFGGKLTCDRPQTAAYLQPSREDTTTILARVNERLKKTGSETQLVQNNTEQQGPQMPLGVLAVFAVDAEAGRRRKRSGEGVRRAVELGCHAASAYGADAQQMADLKNPRYKGAENSLPARARR